MDRKRRVVPIKTASSACVALLALLSPLSAFAAEGEGEPAGAPEPQPSVRDSPTTGAPDRRASSGLGFDLSLGALSTLRTMNFAGDLRRIEHRPGIYFGGVLRGRQTIATFGEANNNFLVEIEGGFGSAQSREAAAGIGRPLVTEHTYAHATSVLEKPLTPNLDFVLGLGLGATAFTVEPNPEYTGHRYFTLITHFGVTRWLAGPYRAFGGLTLYPGLSTNQSAGGYGSARSFGGRAELGGAWRFFQPTAGDMFGTAELEARYTYARFHTTYPETQALGDRPGSTDQAHTLVLMVSYSL